MHATATLCGVATRRAELTASLQAIETLRGDAIPFDAAAFRVLAEKLKFFEALPESRVFELSFARYEATATLGSVRAESVRSVTLAP